MNKSKIIRIFKYIVINFTILIVLFLILEIIAFSIKLNVLKKEGCFSSKTIIECIQDTSRYFYNCYKNNKNSPINIYEMRKPIIKNNNGSIILLGCSYTYGRLLKDNETFGSILSDYTNKSVYNWGISFTSPREILYLLQHKDIISKLIKDENSDKVEYVIYTFISDHIFRLYYNLAEYSPIYKLKNNTELVYKKNSIYNATFFSREIQKIKYYFSSDEDKNNLFYIYINSIDKEIKKNFKYKNKETKFIILVYGDNSIIDWDKISKIDDNIIIVKITDIIETNIDDDKYVISKYDCHPNAQAWNLIVPALMKYIESIE